MKVIINRCWGGFGLSKAAYKELGLEWDGYGYDLEDDRTNSELVRVVEKLGSAASGSLSHLVVVEIPDGIEYEINNYDGQETIHEEHRSW